LYSIESRTVFKTGAFDLVKRNRRTSGRLRLSCFASWRLRGKGNKQIPPGHQDAEKPQETACWMSNAGARCAQPCSRLQHAQEGDQIAFLLRCELETENHVEELDRVLQSEKTTIVNQRSGLH